MSNSWHIPLNADDIPTPALLVYPDRIRENIRRMIRMAGGVAKLRPHVKTHKMADVTRLHLEAGITKFKCATITEAEMAAACGAPDVLLAYQPTGPNAQRLLKLIQAFPGTKFSTIADDEGNVRVLSKVFAGAGVTVDVLLDIDCGMHRSGILPGKPAAELYRLITELPGLSAGGLHVYDGHLHTKDLAERTAQYESGMAPVREFRQILEVAGLSVPRLVGGGTPTFPLHAQSGEAECSPGTCVLWDFGYGDQFPDLDFLHAAVLMTRVVSKPGGNRLCLDLGHKAVAPEKPAPRVRLFDLPDARETTHSEEHLVIETARAGEFKVGDCLYGIPRHICPTVALHNEVVVVEDGRATGRWPVTARGRRLTI